MIGEGRAVQKAGLLEGEGEELQQGADTTLGVFPLKSSGSSELREVVRIAIRVTDVPGSVLGVGGKLEALLV